MSVQNEQHVVFDCQKCSTNWHSLANIVITAAIITITMTTAIIITITISTITMMIAVVKMVVVVMTFMMMVMVKLWFQQSEVEFC